VRERDPAEALDRHHRGDRLAREREGAARAGVKQERLVVHDEVLVEGEAARYRHCFRRQGRADAVDAGGDLVDPRPRLRVGDHVDPPAPCWQRRDRETMTAGAPSTRSSASASSPPPCPAGDRSSGPGVRTRGVLGHGRIEAPHGE
jgi:hypothetical protein